MEFKQYPSYKKSGVEWLGDVPEHWNLKRFGYLFDENKKKNIGLKETNVLSLSYGNIKEKNIDDNKGLLPESFETYQIIEPNNIVFRFTDLQNDKRSLRSAISKYHGIITSAYIAVKTKQNADFYNYLFRAYDLQKVFYSMGEGMRQSLKMDELNKMPVVLPNKDEQKRIVSFLDTETARIDTLIAKQEKLIELLEEQRKSIISHAVTKGLNPNAPMKDSGVEWLGEVPESWVEQKIKFISKLINEKTSEKSNVIALENIESWTGKYIETESSFESDAVKFKKNDVLFGKLRPYLAKVYLVENQGEAVGDIYVLRPNKLIHPQFLKFFMLSEKFIDYVNSSTNGTKMPRANWDFIGCISIFLPHIKVQHEIVEYLESAVLKIELIINKQISLIEKLKEYRSSIISHAVTGKIDVREFGA
ncbi:restriction endonuclease subunit S [Acinetobacter radioresistens]|uniref:restriction endonuclease subunit S n=1 Tax=Acinetobacter radioresistens TaxID=40216 RepID=UPI00028BFB78|nr:restriction endonuclease subunit S [Acinetobacter radioresistens]BBL22340.1 hypothetical protein ACRAD_30110 [Acinetobacter radioresistens DSM 6976 = NBRC 102413 = CIP 103788]